MVNLMPAQKGGDYLKEDGTLDVNNDKVVEVLQYIKTCRMPAHSCGSRRTAG